MQEVWALSPQQTVELRESAQVSPRVDRPAELLEVHELHSQPLRRVADEGPAVRTDDDVVLPGEGRQERGDVPLGASDLAESHEHEDAGTAVAFAAGSRRRQGRAL